MILSGHGQTALARVGGRPLGHRPRLEHPVHLQPKVIVERARIMLLNHKEGPIRGHSLFSTNLQHRRPAYLTVLDLAEGFIGFF